MVRRTVLSTCTPVGTGGLQETCTPEFTSPPGATVPCPNQVNWKSYFLKQRTHALKYKVSKRAGSPTALERFADGQVELSPSLPGQGMCLVSSRGKI